MAILGYVRLLGLFVGYVVTAVCKLAAGYLVAVVDEYDVGLSRLADLNCLIDAHHIGLLVVFARYFHGLAVFIDKRDSLYENVVIGRLIGFNMFVEFRN